MAHLFIFTPGCWEGEGKIEVPGAENLLSFKSRWIILPKEGGEIHFLQEISLEGVAEKRRNRFSLEHVSKLRFNIVLESSLVGVASGRGKLTSKAIEWTIKSEEANFEGREIYTCQPDGSYKMKGTFSSGNGLESHISATLWEKE